MAEGFSFTAQTRDETGKGSARALRRQGQLPAIIYGKEIEPVLIALDGKEMGIQMTRPGLFTSVVEIKVGGDTHRVLTRELQQDPVTDKAIHVDFLKFSADTSITVDIPVTFINEEDSPGLARGGVLNIVRREVELVCSPEHIPQALIFDLTNLDIGASIHISATELPEGVSLNTDRDFTVATVAAPTILEVEEEETEEGEEGEEGLEGEEGEEGEEGAEGEGGGEEAKEGGGKE